MLCICSYVYYIICGCVLCVHACVRMRALLGACARVRTIQGAVTLNGRKSAHGDSMTANPRYAQGRSRQEDTTDKYHGGSDAVRYIHKQDSINNYVDLSQQTNGAHHTQRKADTQTYEGMYVEPNCGPSPIRSVGLNASTLAADMATYETSSGPAVMQPVTLNPNTIAADMATYETSSGPAAMQPVTLNPNTIAADKAMYETAHASDPSTNYYEVQTGK